jgi:hypothetical protein
MDRLTVVLSHELLLLLKILLTPKKSSRISSHLLLTSFSRRISKNSSQEEFGSSKFLKICRCHSGSMI